MSNYYRMVLLRMWDPWRLGFLSVSLTIMSPVPKIVSDTWEVINNICWKKKKLLLVKSVLKLITGTSLVVQWIGIHLAMQGALVRSLAWEDSTCHRTAKPVHHSYWARVLQLLKTTCLQPVLSDKGSRCNEKPMRCNYRIAPALQNKRKACAR